MTLLYYLCAYLFIALILLAFFREKICRNDPFTQLLGALVISIPLTLIIYNADHYYNLYWQKESARIEQNVWMQVKTMCDKHSIPKGMKGPVPELTLAEDGKAVGYYCKRAGK